jgi:anthranilate phosphoribosyltransferase
MTDMVKEIIRKLVDGIDLNEEETADAFRRIIMGEATNAQIGAFLTALRMKGETVEEMIGMTRVMRSMCVKVEVGSTQGLIDIVGTGGDRFKTFNISTVAALIVAGAGGKVAKHGNRAITGRCGSADLLEALGVNINAGPERVKECISSANIGFMFAPNYHPAMRRVMEPRREIGIRTIFNVLGPITNPAGVVSQVVGVSDEDLIVKVARALPRLGCRHAMVVHGHEGMDEISVSGETKIAWIKEGEISLLELHPSRIGIKPVKPDLIISESVEKSVETAVKVLNNCYPDDDPRKLVAIVNAAAGLLVAGLADRFDEAVELAKEALESGRALKRLEELVKVSGGDHEKYERVVERYAGYA